MTMTPDKIEKLLERAEIMASEIRAQSINGWGNTVDDLAAAIRQLQSELAALKAQGTFNDGVEAVMPMSELANIDSDACINLELCEEDDGQSRCIASFSVGQILDLLRPTSQIQGEVGKEFPAEGEGK